MQDFKKQLILGILLPILIKLHRLQLVLYRDVWRVIQRFKMLKNLFFSGHAVISFVGLLYTTFLLRRVLLVPAGVWTSAESLLCTAPLFLASWISLTRIQDGEHHPVDVVAGTLVGILIASLVWTTVQNIVKAELKKVSSTPIQSSGNLG